MNYLDFTLPDWPDFNEGHFLNVELPVIEEIVARYEEGNRLVVLSAPTGVGKTVVGECVRQRLNAKGMYVCTSLTLQDQFLQDFTWAREIRGRSNYTPLNNLPDFYGDTPTCADCDYDNVTKLCSYCDPVSGCPYTQAKNAASSSPLACTNTAYFLGEANGQRSQFAGRDLVIIDEADTLESIVMNQVSISISPRLQKYLDLRAPAKKTVESTWQQWIEYAIPHIERRYNIHPDSSLKDRRRKGTIGRLLENMYDIAAHMDEYVYDYGNDYISFKPITVNRIAPKVLWPHGQRFLSMSASIIPEEFVESLGFEDAWAPVFAPSVFDPERRPIYFTPVAPMSKKTENTAWPTMVEAVKEIIDWHPGESILFHSHSYALTKYVYNQLIDADIDRDVFAYFNASSRAEAIANFEATPGSVMLAPSMDRGYDGKDDKVRVVVLLKVPYAYLGDKQVEKRLYSTRGGRLWYASQTARTITQMVGRGMRHENDRCVTYIADSLFSSFYADWKLQGRVDGPTHRLFPPWFVEALHMESEPRFKMRQAMKSRTQEVAIGTRG